ncbi:MAG: alpha-L-fucosidase, partial [Lacipirellulaceae bacterium]
AAWVIHDFIDIVAKNGQLLLNISPKADGTIPEDQRKVLAKLGEWLKANGESIYGTRPWKIYGEGPTQMEKGGHFTKHVDYTAQDIRFTTKGDTLYAISLGTPQIQLTIKSLAKGSPHYSDEVSKVTTLNGNYIASWSQDDVGLHIELSPDAPQQIAYAFRIE